MNKEAMLTQFYSVWTVVRHIAFWVKWAFYVFFAVPSVVLCLALAAYSGFSFSTIPRDFYQYAAELAKYPAAADGYLTVEVCKDPTPTDSASLPKPTPICKTHGLEQKPIESLAQDTARTLGAAYLLVVFLGAASASMLGLFGSSRRTLLASIGVLRSMSASQRTSTTKDRA